MGFYICRVCVHLVFEYLRWNIGRSSLQNAMRWQHAHCVSTYQLALMCIDRLQAVEDIGESTFIEYTEDSLNLLQKRKQHERSRHEEKKKELQSPSAQDTPADA